MSGSHDIFLGLAGPLCSQIYVGVTCTGVSKLYEIARGHTYYEQLIHFDCFDLTPTEIYDVIRNLRIGIGLGTNHVT